MLRLTRKVTIVISASRCLARFQHLSTTSQPARATIAPPLNKQRPTTPPPPTTPSKASSAADPKQQPAPSSSQEEDPLYASQSFQRAAASLSGSLLLLTLWWCGRSRRGTVSLDDLAPAALHCPPPDGAATSPTPTTPSAPKNVSTSPASPNTTQQGDKANAVTTLPTTAAAAVDDDTTDLSNSLFRLHVANKGVPTPAEAEMHTLRALRHRRCGRRQESLDDLVEALALFAQVRKHKGYDPGVHATAAVAYARGVDEAALLSLDGGATVETTEPAVATAATTNNSNNATLTTSWLIVKNWMGAGATVAAVTPSSDKLVARLPPPLERPKVIEAWLEAESVVAAAAVAIQAARDAQRAAVVPATESHKKNDLKSSEGDVDTKKTKTPIPDGSSTQGGELDKRASKDVDRMARMVATRLRELQGTKSR